MFWDIYKTISYNCLFNFIIGNRGGGKTFGFKSYAIKDFIKHKKQFVYLRRYKEELKDIATFWNDISGEYADHKFSVRGKELLIDNEVAGWAMCLSTAKIKKSNSYPNVNKICYDEFILDKGVYHYLQDEVVNFLEFYETIARMRDVKVFFLSNAITRTNPYFLFFNIQLPYGSMFKRYDDVLIELVQNQDYIDAKKQTRFAKIIEGTEYSKYSIENNFFRDTNTFIKKLTGNSEYMFGLLINEKMIGVWIDYKEGVYIVSDKYDPLNKIIYACTNSDHNPNTMLLKSKRKSIFKTFVEHYMIGNVRFENIEIKNIVEDVLRKTV